MKYDPLRNPEPETWLQLDEAERHILVEEYHRRKKIRMPNIQVHSIFHAVVETQVAMGDPHPAKRLLERLMKEGLDRHEAVHAIGSVVAAQFFGVMKGTITAESDINRDYKEKLERLTAQSWRESHGEP